jgi:hypothetical protein
MVRAAPLKKTRNSPKETVGSAPPWFQPLPCEIDAEVEQARRAAEAAAGQAAGVPLST